MTGLFLFGIVCERKHKVCEYCYEVGYKLRLKMMKSIIALGAENKNTFSVISGKNLYISKRVSDLRDIDNLQDFEQALRGYIKSNGVIARYIACDSHPDYCSTHLAQRLQRENKGARLIRVQHHFAHIVSCMKDNNLDEGIIGVSFDGTGYGTDGKSWGGEFLLCTRKDFRRLNHLRYAPQPGGDIAAREGWRMALAYLLQAYGRNFYQLKLSLFERIEKAKIKIICQMLEKDINCPLTSSAGRLFDAVSSLIGVCDVSRFEAEAAILLEQAALRNIGAHYLYEIKAGEVDVCVMFRQIVDDLNKGLDTGIISAKFQNTLGEIIFALSLKISEDTGVNKVLISGGCFQNRYLTDYIVKRFANSKLKLYSHNKYSTTDWGISVGQAVVAASL